MTDTIKPAAWAFQHSHGAITLHPASEYLTAYRDTCIATHPLYDQQALDASVAQERAEIATLRRQLAAAKVVIAGQDDRAKLLGAEFSALCAQAAEVAGEREANAILTDEIDRLRAALRELRHDAMRALVAWDGTVLPKSHDGMMQERMECLRAALRQIAAIEDKMFGGVWEEIEEARTAARAALGASA